MARGRWITVRGESIGRLTTEGDPMIDPISEAEAIVINPDSI